MEFDFIKVNKPLDTPNINAQVEFQIGISDKVGRVFSMVIWSEFRMGQYRENHHREDASQFRTVLLGLLGPKEAIQHLRRYIYYNSMLTATIRDGIFCQKRRIVHVSNNDI